MPSVAQYAATAVSSLFSSVDTKFGAVALDHLKSGSDGARIPGLTIDNLHSSKPKHSVICNNFATTNVFFAWTFAIALVYANYFDLYAARMMSYDRHVKYGNDCNDALNATVFSDFRKLKYGKCCTQMYIDF